MQLTSGCEGGVKSTSLLPYPSKCVPQPRDTAFMSVLSLPDSEGRDSVPRSETALEQGCATARCLLRVLGVSAPQERDVGQRQDVGLPICGPEGLLCGGFIEDSHRGTGNSQVDSQQQLSVGGDGGGAVEANQS